MRVIMEKTCMGSPNGIEVLRYEAGQEYDLTGLPYAEAWVANGSARKATGGEKKAFTELENKAVQQEEVESKDFADMTADEMRAVAEEKGLDVSRLNTRKKLLKALSGE